MQEDKKILSTEKLNNILDEWVNETLTYDMVKSRLDVVLRKWEDIAITDITKHIVFNHNDINYIIIFDDFDFIKFWT